LIDTTLPIHAVTGIQALGWRKARRGETGPQPIWPILGGAEDDTEGGDDADASDKSGEDAAADQGDDSDDESGEVDWEAKAKEAEAKFEAQQRINRDLERRTKRTARRLAELEGKPAAAAKDTKTDDGKTGEVDVEKIRAEALEQAKKEAQQEALKERVLDKIEAKAAKEFADPADAVAMLMRVRSVDDFIDDGKVDAEAIQDALKDLLENKPYLGAAAAQGGKSPRFQGSADAGAKPTKPARPKSLDEAVRQKLGAK